jgi:hypothetical protein
MEASSLTACSYDCQQYANLVMLCSLTVVVGDHSKQLDVLDVDSQNDLLTTIIILFATFKVSHDLRTPGRIETFKKNSVA